MPVCQECEQYGLNHFKWRNVGLFPLALPFTSITGKGGSVDGRPF